MRRLPVYLLIDTSGSMKGEPIESVRVGLETMVSTLRQDPFALESAYLSIITFDTDVRVLVELSELEHFQMPTIVMPDSGATHLGRALEVLCGQVDKEVQRGTPDRKGDWRPLLFVMTDGRPADLEKYREMIPEVRRRGFARIVACAAGPKAREGDLRELADTLVSLETTDSTTFREFFKWVSASVSAGTLTESLQDGAVPPPPPEVHIVI